MKRSSPLRRTAFKRNFPAKRSPSAAKPNPKTSIPKTVREEVGRRARGQCEFVWVDGNRCDRQPEACHHRLMRSQGGGHTADNLLALCNEHHRWVHAHPRISYENGWLIRRS